MTRPLREEHVWQASITMGPKNPTGRETKESEQAWSLPLLQRQSKAGERTMDPTPQLNHNLSDPSLPGEMISTFNIGGTIFETYQSTLRKLPNSPLSDGAFLYRYYRQDRDQYFFDRDPDVFGAILNYLRTGELHLPIKYCGPAVKTELEFWGVGEDEIEECCWTKYSAWTTTLEALKKLEKDRKVNIPRSVDQIDEDPSTDRSTLRQVQIRGWALLNSPHSSPAAQSYGRTSQIVYFVILFQIYSYLSLVFVVVSIFSFIAQTHPFFRVTVENANTSSQHEHNSTAKSRTQNVTSSAEETDAHPAMLYVDVTCLAFFVIEFLLRILFSPRKCKLFKLPMTVFELLALLPDLIEFGWRVFSPTLRATVSAVQVITFLRLLRVFRIFRLMRHFPGLWILFYTLKASIKELLLLLLFLCVGMLFFASIIYYTDDHNIFTSIPMACWWSIVTMTTVGYGDMSPSTSLGYLVGSMTAICGVLVIGFTVPVLVNNFILYYHHTQCAMNRENAKRKRDEIKLTMQRLNLSEDTGYKPFISEKLRATCPSNNLEGLSEEKVC
ncbi:potassium voltage-gated channel protein Shaw-like [Babylonia areolata]|uniref:potassium voltage-gated channel protein Shaw-like n=1 Tax=Babylonia areolata TaxID=304850 RepID=UPI003FD0A2DC